MPRKQLNIGLTVEQRTQVDAVAAAEGTTPICPVCPNGEFGIGPGFVYWWVDEHPGAGAV